MTRRAFPLLAVAALAAVTVGALEQVGVGRGLELETVDARFRIRGPITPPADVVIVHVDETTLSEMQERWPFPRAKQADLIDRLAVARPRAIAIDLQYTEPTTEDDDNALIDAIDNADRVVLATTTVDDQGATNVLGGDDVVSDIGARVGSALMPLDADGAIRRAAYQVEGLESFAVVTAEVATNRQVDPFDEDRTWIRYAGPPQTLPASSYSKVLHGDFPPKTFENKIVVVGTEALRLKDASTTSTTDGSLMSGPEVQGNALATVLANLPLRSPGGVVGLMLIVLFAALTPLAAAFVRPLFAVAIGALAGIAWLPGAQALFSAGTIVPVVHPLAACALGIIGVLALARSAPRIEAAPEEPAPTQAEPLATLVDEIGGFQLEELLGRGGMGVVYRAEQPGLDRKVAVKVIAPGHAADSRFRERFAREARLAAALDHPHIVPVYTTGEDAGQLYLVMRYIDGVNLAERLRGDPLPLADVAAIVSQVASALDAAHGRGIVHRDVKPANILLVERDDHKPHAYLTDFGITRELGGTEGLTQAGAFLGSLDYAAPEQATGAGPRADQYSLGCVAYECLTGRPPFGGRRDVEILWAHAHEAPQALAELPPEANEAVLRALAKDPEARWPDCASFAAKLASALVEVA
jgi:serine/threonine-protein kinase